MLRIIYDCLSKANKESGASAIAAQCRSGWLTSGNQGKTAIVSSYPVRRLWVVLWFLLVTAALPTLLWAENQSLDTRSYWLSLPADWQPQPVDTETLRADC